MRRLPLRRLVAGERPAPDRIVYTNIWPREHVNRRSEELLERLGRVDAYLLHVPARQPIRGIHFRALYRTRRLRDRLVLGAASRRYRFMLTTDNEQIPLFRGRVVADVDDPTFSDREVGLLNAANLAAYVVTAERAGRRFEELGVRTPWHVIPQGVSLRSLEPGAVAEVAGRHRREGELAVGYMAAWLVTEADRDGSDPLYNVDHLLELWDEIHARVPEARLWLIGGASERLRARCAGRGDVLVLGRVRPDQALPHLANLDVALYPRRADQGIRASKIAEYLGAGVPIVSYDLSVTEDVRETGAGVLVQTPREFAEAVERLATDEPHRKALADSAQAAGRARDWDTLARRYETEILDRYLS